jgi:Xaa-Pro aminopeptidase
MPFNLEYANKIMDTYKIDALVAADPVTMKHLGFDMWLNFSKEWNLKPGGSIYPELVSLCVIPYKKPPVYILNSEKIAYLEKGSIDNIIPFGIYTKMDPLEEPAKYENKSDLLIYEIHKNGILPDIMEALVFAFKENGLENSTVAIEEIGTKPEFLTDIKSKFKNCRFKDSTEIFRLIRMVKEPEEIKLLKRSIDITEEAFKSSINLLKDKKIFGEARGEFIRSIQSQNAFLNNYVIFSKGFGFNELPDYKIENDSVMAIDFGCSFNHYLCDTAATIFAGHIDRKNHEIYKKLLDLLETSLSAIKPGIKCSEVYNMMIKKRNMLGMDYCPVYGHGIGIQHWEYPVINKNLNYFYNDGFKDRSGDFTIEKNMVINVEVPTHYHNDSSFSIEKTVYVTENGSVELSKQSREKPVTI